jgi:mRNA interferase RelE/StbE
VSFRVEVQRSAGKELAKVSSVNQPRIARALLALAEDPFPPGYKKLRGSDGYRIRVGDYRILYTVDTEAQAVFVSAIGHRRDVYR